MSYCKLNSLDNLPNLPNLNRIEVNDNFLDENDFIKLKKNILDLMLLDVLLLFRHHL